MTPQDVYVKKQEIETERRRGATEEQVERMERELYREVLLAIGNLDYSTIEAQTVARIATE